MKLKINKDAAMPGKKALLYLTNQVSSYCFICFLCKPLIGEQLQDAVVCP